jgi:hypothetical protein
VSTQLQLTNISYHIKVAILYTGVDNKSARSTSLDIYVLQASLHISLTLTEWRLSLTLQVHTLRKKNTFRQPCGYEGNLWFVLWLITAHGEEIKVRSHISYWFSCRSVRQVHYYVILLTIIKSNRIIIRQLYKLLVQSSILCCHVYKYPYCVFTTLRKLTLTPIVYPTHVRIRTQLWIY